MARGKPISPTREEFAEWNDKRDTAMFDSVCDHCKVASTSLEIAFKDMLKIEGVESKEQARKIIKALLTSAINKL